MGGQSSHESIIEQPQSPDEEIKVSPAMFIHEHNGNFKSFYTVGEKVGEGGFG